MKFGKIKELANKKVDIEELTEIDTKTSRYLIYFSTFIAIFILVGIFILAAPGILGEYPIAMDEKSYKQYRIIKKVKRHENTTILFDKNGNKTQIVLPNEVIKFITDFDLEEPILKIYDPRFVVMKNVFYNREVPVNKENQKFKIISEQMKKRNNAFFIYNLIDNK